MSPGARTISGNSLGGVCNYVSVQDQRSDGELVAASLDGDQAAFGRLVDRHGGRVASLARRMLGDAAEAEDLTQETLLHAYLGLEQLREPDRFSSWVYGIALNLARMRLRDRRDGALPLPLEGGRRVPALLAAGPSPAEVVETRGGDGPRPAPPCAGAPARPLVQPGSDEKGDTDDRGDPRGRGRPGLDG
ncbi:MAG: hypothetical protein E6G42_04245 [Actinobacteria bacterium]|nr:MAG: hypothetical protein E6G42_04245 [Actinomycetota bacterium]